MRIDKAALLRTLVLTGWAAVSGLSCHSESRECFCGIGGPDDGIDASVDGSVDAVPDDGTPDDAPSGDGGASDEGASDGGLEADAGASGDDAGRVLVDSGCPESYDAASGRPGCGSPGLQCAYPEGPCECVEGCGPPEPPDAQKPYWQCGGAPGAGCPREAPDSGDDCAADGVECTYGACCGPEAKCESGRWHVVVVCPP